MSLCAVVLAAGCSHGSSSSKPSSPAASSGTGPNPIVVGLINTEDAPVGSFPDLRRGVIAAERYVNDRFGGVGGRPIEIVPCATDGTPESSQGCANTLLNRHVVAVIGGVDLGAASSLPPLQVAGVPYVGGTPAATEALTSSGSFMFTGGTATEVLGEVSYAAKTLHVTRLSAVYVDVPGLLSTAVGLLSSIAHKLGVTQFKTVPVQPDTPDIAPALAAAASIHPQAILAVFPGQTCTRVIEGVAALGGGARMMYPSLCAGQQALAAAGSAGDGSVIASGYRPYTDTGDKDVAVYLSALHRYDRTLEPSLLSQAGFSVVMNLRQVMSEVTGTLTPKSLSAALFATHDHANFMSAPFTCDGKQIPMLRSLCNASTQISVIHGGKLEPVGGPIDTAPLATLAVP